MQGKILVDEEALVQLTAQVTLQQYMIELLATFFINYQIGEEHRSGLLDDIEAATKKVIVGRAANERDAIMLSDIAMRVQEEGKQIVDRLRVRLLKSEEKIPGERYAG